MIPRIHTEWRACQAKGCWRKALAVVVTDGDVEDVTGGRLCSKCEDKFRTE